MTTADYHLLEQAQRAADEAFMDFVAARAGIPYSHTRADAARIGREYLRARRALRRASAETPPASRVPSLWRV